MAWLGGSSLIWAIKVRPTGGRMRRAAHAMATVARTPDLLRASLAFLAFIVVEYAAWIVVLIYAFNRGGVTAAGLIAVAQLVPAALFAPFMATLADTRSPIVLMAGGFLLQAVTLGFLSAAVLLNGPDAVVYALAIISSIWVTTTRPAASVAGPGLARTPDQLTALNVSFGWMENVGIVLASLLVGIGLEIGSLGLVLAIVAVIMAVAFVGTCTLRVQAIGVTGEGESTSAAASVGHGFRLLRSEPKPRLLVMLLTAEFVVLGALDVLFVVIAIDVLGKNDAWVGYLNTADGVGGICAGLLTALLVGRRLGRPILVAGLAIAAGVALVAFSSSVVVTLGLLAVVGGGRAAFDVATRTLLQRAVPADMIARVFGVVEGLAMAGLAVGSVIPPILIALGGPKLALLGVAAVVPLAALLGGRALLALDAGAPVPVVEIALLRGLPHFAALPAPAMERLARTMERRDMSAGATIVRQGEVGEEFFAIGDGRVKVEIDGAEVRQLTRGEGFGEVALLHDGTRSATITALVPTSLYVLGRDDFLAALTDHHATHTRVRDVAEGHLEHDRTLSLD